MKLCPVCKNAIIPDAWKYCLACQYEIDPKHAAWDGGFPCGWMGKMVAFKCINLTVKNEIVECENEKGFAIYDENDKNVGVLYQKIDEDNYETRCRMIRGEFLRRRLSQDKCDVEAVFFKKYRDVYGDNRKIVIGKHFAPLFFGFDEIKNELYDNNSVEYTFFNLRGQQ